MKYTYEELAKMIPGMPRAALEQARPDGDRLVRTVRGVGFEFVDGPELESYACNFAALNYPEDHPAFDEQMTFYVDDERAGTLAQKVEAAA